jgi:uncharacterized protein
MRVLFACVCMAMVLAGAAHAQTAPSATEIAAYNGLLAAAARGDAATVEALARAGARLDQRDGHGRTAVHIAAHGSHDDVVVALAKANADLNARDSRQYDIVTIVSVSNDVALLSLALSLGASARQITSPYDGTALIAAAHLGHAEAVRQLIVAGAPLDHVNNLGWTALMESIVLGDGGRAHQDTLKALLDAGADHTIADRSGVTPLEQARRRGYTDMVVMLTAAQRPAR